MTDKRITDLTAIAAPLTRVDEFEVQRSGQSGSEKATGDQLANLFGYQGGQFPFIASGYLTNPMATYSTQALANGSLRIVPIIVPYRRAFTKLAFELTTVAASSNVRMGLYRSDPSSDYKPTTLVTGTDGGAFDTSATTGKRETTFSSVTLDPGVYWGAINSDGAPTLRSVFSGAFVCGYDFGNNQLRMYSASVAYAAMSSDLSAQSWTASGLLAPILGIR